jgi:hypothetical protein
MMSEFKLGNGVCARSPEGAVRSERPELKRAQKSWKTRSRSAIETRPTRAGDDPWKHPKEWTGACCFGRLIGSQRSLRSSNEQTYQSRKLSQPRSKS